MRDIHAPDPHALRGYIDIDIDDGGHIRLGRVVLDVPESASFRSSAACFALPGPWRPVRELRRRPHDCNRARVCQMTQPEFDWIDASSERQLIHERLVGETVLG